MEGNANLLTSATVEAAPKRDFTIEWISYANHWNIVIILVTIKITD